MTLHPPTSPVKMSTHGDQKYLLYHYNPNEAAAIIFIVLFSVVTSIHAFQLFTRRTWYFIPFLIGGIFEFLGYIGRCINATEAFNEWSLGPYILMSLTTLLAPALFAASIYMVLGRLILLVDGSHHSPIRVNWLTRTFVAGDVIAFLAQSGGGGLLASAKTESQTKTYEDIITGGLAIQLLFFGMFMVCTLVFHMRMRKAPTIRSEQLKVNWESYIYVLYVTSAFIMIRNIYRIIEYVMGQDGYLLGHEYSLYVFDALLMFFTMVIFAVWHPSGIIGAGRKSIDAESSRSTHDMRPVVMV